MQMEGKRAMPLMEVLMIKHATGDRADSMRAWATRRISTAGRMRLARHYDANLGREKGLIHGGQRGLDHATLQPLKGLASGFLRLRLPLRAPWMGPVMAWHGVAWRRVSFRFVGPALNTYYHPIPVWWQSVYYYYCVLLLGMICYGMLLWYAMYCEMQLLTHYTVLSHQPCPQPSAMSPAPISNVHYRTVNTKPIHIPCSPPAVPNTAGGQYGVCAARFCFGARRDSSLLLDCSCCTKPTLVFSLGRCRRHNARGIMQGKSVDVCAVLPW